MICVIIVGVLASAICRGLERLIGRKDRLLTAPITQIACRLGLRIIGLQLQVKGKPMRHGGAVVANHASWLDIMTLHGVQRVVFVSKAEVARWPVIGFLARLVGTVFIRRDRRDARHQSELFRKRVEHGEKLLFFPEGTSTDGMRVLPFKSTLFEAFFTKNLLEHAHIQPVSVVYEAPAAASEPRFYAWWGDMELGAHGLGVLGTSPQGRVTVVFHPPLAVSDFANRKELAIALEAQVRAGMPTDRQGAQ